MDFQNERSGHTCKRINVIDLSLNIAERASRLANQFGVAITENDWQSSSNLLNSLAGFDKSDVPGSEWDLSLDTYMNKVSTWTTSLSIGHVQITTTAPLP